MKETWHDIESTVFASVIICVVIGLVILGLIFQEKTECEEHVGSAYVYDNGECYRLLEDDTWQLVNVSLEKKIEEARGQ